MTFTIHSVLVEYDGPQVVEATDPIGDACVGVLVDEPSSRFFLAGVSGERLRRFRMGEVDLRALLARPGDEPGWLGVLQDGRISADLVPGPHPEYLPESGFFLEPASRDVERISDHQEQQEIEAGRRA